MYLHLGGGSWSYDFAYYGLYTDVLVMAIQPAVRDGVTFGRLQSLASIVLGTDLLFWFDATDCDKPPQGAAHRSAALYAAATCLFPRHNS